jgi:hypothetical protein
MLNIETDQFMQTLLLPVDQDTAKQSRQTYVDYVVQLNKVLSLKDAYDRGKPLLASTVNAIRVAGLVSVR